MSAKRATAVLFLVLGAACLPCAGRSTPAAENGTPVLHVYTWEDYFAPEAIRIFEERNGCRVEFDYYDSNETMLTTLSEGGGYDVMTPDPATAAFLNRTKKLHSLDHSLLPNLKYLDRKTSALTEDPGMRYSIPYTVTVTGVGYNRTQVEPEAIGSWEIFSDRRLAKRMTMLNDMREVLGASLKHLGYSLNSINPAEVKTAGEVILDWKRNLALFEVDKAKEGLRNGKFVAIQAYNGDVVSIMEENPDIDFFVPSEGSSLNSDDFVIGVDSPVPGLAHAFINHFLDPGIAAMNMESVKYFMPNPEALSKLPPRLRQNSAFNVPGDTIAKCEVIRNLGDDTSLYDATWEQILIGKQ